MLILKGIRQTRGLDKLITWLIVPCHFGLHLKMSLLRLFFKAALQIVTTNAQKMAKEKRNRETVKSLSTH